MSLRDRLLEDHGVKLRQLHRLVDLGFPEFTRHVKLDTELACALLCQYPTAQAFAHARLKAISNLKSDGRHFVGLPLARTLQQAATASVGAHHAAPFQQGVKYACEDLSRLRQRLRQADDDIGLLVDKHELGSLLTSIDGLGPTTVARLLASVGDPASVFPDGNALVSFVGCAPAVSHSGKRTPSSQGLCRIGDARLRAALWMPTLTAVRSNGLLKDYYERLLARGKRKKVALVACMRKLLLVIYSVAKRRQPFLYPLPPPAPPSPTPT
ncbi:transposase [Archangium gephyra]|uniref:transposase n=1 Tax=Archangium gephyra TaxID=48 RepID=UPI003B7EB593